MIYKNGEMTVKRYFDPMMEPKENGDLENCIRDRRNC